jgi:hypothetical protein
VAVVMTRDAAIGAMAFAVSLLPAAAQAQGRVTFVPSISVTSVYDNNLFARRVGSGDQMTRLAPGLEASYESPVTSIAGLYSFEAQRSLDHPALNDIEARRHAILETQFHQSPSFTLALNGRYDQTDAAGELNVITGLLFDRRRSQRWQLTPSLAYQLGTRTTVTLLYDWTTEGIEGTPMANEHVGRMNVARQVSPRVSAGAGALVRHFINGPETQTSIAGLAMFSRQLSPFTSVMIQAGPRLSSQRQLAAEVVAALTRRGANSFGYAVDYWRGESIILGVLGPVEVTSATAGLARPIVRQVELGVRGGLFNSTTLEQGSARVYHAEAVTAWSPKAMLTVAASYGADFQRGDVRTSLLSDQKVIRHVFLVRLTVAPRLSRTLQPEDPLRPIGEPSRGIER